MRKELTSRRGQSLVEFALITPVFLLLVFGIFDFARLMFTMATTSNALRNAARYATVIGYADIATPTFLDCEKIEAAALNTRFLSNQTVTIEYEFVYEGGVPPTLPTAACGTVGESDLSNGDILHITSQGTFTFLTPVISRLIGDIDLNFEARRTILKSLFLGLEDTGGSTDPCLSSVDTDFDYLADLWEELWWPPPGFDLNHMSGTDDPDGDACNNACENRRCTNPLDADTDGDGLNDGEEVYIFRTDPDDIDTDGDGRTDWEELNEEPLTNPLIPDTDNDGLLDGPEFDDYKALGCPNPTLTDTDLDGDTDGEEVAAGTDPCGIDSDHDGLNDSDEIITFYSDHDPDNDGYTDPDIPDTDGDTLSDGDEALIYNTNPVKDDTDNDGLTDDIEVVTPPDSWMDTNPNLADTDGDTLSDYHEIYVSGTYPNDTDTDNDSLLDNVDPDPTHALDSDGDGLPDDWEMTKIHTLAEDQFADSDNDDCNNQCEYEHGTDPLDADTDDDGLNDGDEIGRGTNPLRGDTDFDGLSDEREVNYYGTNPLLPDTDGDSLKDGNEIGDGTDPLLRDTDSDGLDDNLEVIHSTDPRLPDTDGDDALDGEEVTATSNPLNPDSDGDGLLDGEELHEHFTSPVRPDTDSDGLSDWEEVVIYPTSPTDPDSDDDGLRDGLEIDNGTNPLYWDTDEDGLSDSIEFYGVTDPTNPDTDGDGINDGQEVNGFSITITVDGAPSTITVTTDPTSVDTDGDGLTDAEETGGGTYVTNPAEADTDGDGLNDGDEVNARGTDPTQTDTDGDYIRDGDEVNVYATDPTVDDHLENYFDATTLSILQTYLGGDLVAAQAQAVAAGFPVDGTARLQVTVATTANWNQSTMQGYVEATIVGGTLISYDNSADSGRAWLPLSGWVHFVLSNSTLSVAQ